MEEFLEALKYFLDRSDGVVSWQLIEDESQWIVGVEYDDGDGATDLFVSVTRQ